MRRINFVNFLIFVFALILLTSNTCGYDSPQSFNGVSYNTGYINPASYRTSYETYYSNNDVRTYWPILENSETCKGKQDLILQMAPAGCQPAVVRSDLLAEQNVPVFCQIDAIKLNPLIDINQIDNIRFTNNNYPKDVFAAGFHPAKAALRTRDKLLGSPLINNIGYVVLILKKNSNESSLPSFVNVSLAAEVTYDAGNALGIGKTDFILKPTSDDEWELEKNQQTFWNGRYSIRLEQATPEFVDVSIYKGDIKISNVRAERGKSSNNVYLPGFYCQASLQLSYDGYVAAEKSARLNIGGDLVDVYRGSTLLNGKCSIEKINVNKSNGDGGSVSIRCSSGERIVLNKALISASTNFAVGDNVLYNGKKANIVSIPSKDQYEINIVDTNQGAIVSANQIQSVMSIKDKEYSAEIESAFNEAIKTYSEVADKYPLEKQKDLGTDVLPTYGEVALDNAIELAELYGKSSTQIQLIDKFLQLYPTSSLVNKYQIKLQNLYKYDQSSGSGVVYVDGKYQTIKLLSLDDPDKKARAEFTIGNNPNSVWLDKGDVSDLTIYSQNKKSTYLGQMSLTYLSAEQARVSAYCAQVVNGREVLDRSGKTYVFNLRDPGQEICGQAVVLEDIDMQQIAKVRLYPTINNARSETNLTVGVGIEKRAIQLSPDKTKEVIANVNKSIAKWESINKGLGQAVTGLKAACFATSAALTVKTFIGGLNGKGIARQIVMKGTNGWDVKCKELVSAGQYKTMDLCLFDKKAEIENDVSVTAEGINNINQRLSGIESKYTSSNSQFSLLGMDKTINREKSAEEYASYLRNTYPNEVVTLQNGKQVKVSELLALKEGEGYANGTYTYDQLKSLELNILTKNDPKSSQNLKESSASALKDTTNRILENKELYNQVEKANELKQFGFARAQTLGIKGQQTLYSDVIQTGAINTATDVKFKDNENTKYSTTFVVGSDTSVGNGIVVPRGNYVAGLKKIGNENKYVINELILVDDNGKPIDSQVDTGRGNKVDVNSREFVGIFNGAFKIKDIAAYDQTSYSNNYKNPQVRYYETDPYKGMPGLVPFDLVKGWYAGTKQTLPNFGGIGAFDSSGRVASFWLCNVGPNGLEQFEEGTGDDICELINLNTGQPTNKFAGLSEKEAEILVSKGVRALNDAANQYGDGKSAVRIDGNTLARGKPSLNLPSSQCQDFMSASDCNILFNVCDPVICPTSRCDFGGKYPVSNVIDTGIIGSIALCLPNFGDPTKGGVAIPVCLTGIHAGIDSFISILKAERDCLQTNLDNGQMVGICDQITSVYTCEFFWRQVAPLANVLLPKIVEWAYTGGNQAARGGGEYLTVLGAWENTKKSVDYFTNVYAVNSLKSYKLRSIEEAGSTFCKAYISAKAPTSFKTLIEPDSPPQFSAWFSSIPFSSATVPATSQYSVFYHIFGGKDSGVYYRVYLKSSAEASYYYTAPIWQVSAGFIPRGEYADEKKDFTAPVGYKELCVDINGEEKCGFKEVSTSFAVNQLRDSYTSSAISQSDITSEKSCISGQANVGAILANSNLQSGLEESALPADYNRGITRICASKNPGSSTEPLRYVDVGYCSDQKVRCWLDKNSVDNAITVNNVAVKNQTLSDLENIQLKALAQEGVILGEQEASAALDQFRGSVKATIETLSKSVSLSDIKSQVSARLSEADTLFGPALDKIYLNNQKAEVIYLKARLNAVVAEAYKRINRVRDSDAAAQVSGQSGTNTSTSSDHSLKSDLVFELKQDSTSTAFGGSEKIYFVYDSINAGWTWSFNALGPWMRLTQEAYTDSSDTKHYGEVPAANSRSAIASLIGKGIDNGDAVLTEQGATLYSGPVAQNNDIIDMVNKKATLSASKYETSKQIFILVDGKNIVNEDELVDGVYIKNNKIYSLKKGFFGVDALNPDKLIGSVQNRQIKLLSSAAAEMGGDYYAIIVDTKIEADRSDGQQLQLSLF